MWKLAWRPQSEGTQWVVEPENYTRAIDVYDSATHLPCNAVFVIAVEDWRVDSLLAVLNASAADLIEEALTQDIDKNVEKKTCCYCESPIVGKTEFAIHRDGFGVGPQLPLCNRCGCSNGPSLNQIWSHLADKKRIAEAAVETTSSVPLIEGTPATYWR